MINASFFPTPASVIDKMVAPIAAKQYGRNLSGLHILEPSAGKGDIVDYLIKKYYVKKERVHCIEPDAELQMILAGKGYGVVGSDFLTYNDRYRFDLIIMNPPFDDGAAHLLKAWDILQSGDIVCLLNAETIRNPHTKERELLKQIIDEHGSVEFIGQAFKRAERPTDVDVAIVRLAKKQTGGGTKFDVDGMEFDAAARDEAFSANPLAQANLIQALVQQYNHAADLIVQADGIEKQIAFYSKGIYEPSYKQKEASQTVNERLDDLKRAFWKYIFDKTKLGQTTTSEFQARFREMLDRTARIAFTETNVMNILETFLLNRDEFMQQCINDVFDTATAYHEKNRIEIEGWKTNKSWKIAPKIIIPSYGNWHSSSRVESFFNDLDKVMSFISGVPYDKKQGITYAIERRLKGRRDYDIQGEWEVPAAERVSYGELFSTRYFDVRVYLKGTVHIKFRDKDLLARFNQAAAKGKNWIGEGGETRQRAA